VTTKEKPSRKITYTKAFPTYIFTFAAGVKKSPDGNACRANGPEKVPQEPRRRRRTPLTGVAGESLPGLGSPWGRLPG